MVSLALIAIILAQSSKGGGLEGIVGSAASSMFGTQGASEFLKKWTKYLAIVFFITSISLAMTTGRIHKSSSSSAIKKLKKEMSAQKNNSVKTDSKTSNKKETPLKNSAAKAENK
jgi:preprotein translocase subunit SecG